MNLEERFLNQAANEKLPEGIVDVLPPIRDPEQFSKTATKRKGGVGFVEGATPSAVSGGATAPTNLTPSGKVTQPAPKQLTQDDINKMIANPAYRFDSVSNQLKDIFNKEPQSELISLNRSMREELAYSMQQLLVNKFGVDNYRANRLSDSLFGGSMSGAPMGLGLIDVTPFVIPLAFQESGLSAKESFSQFDRGNYGQAALDYGVGILQGAEAIPAVGMAVKGLKAGAEGLRAGAEALAPAAADVIESGLRRTGMIADIVPFTAKGKLSDITNTITELSTAGVEPKTIMDAEKAFSNGERVFAFAEMDEMPMLIRNVGDLKAYTPDQLLVLPAKQQAQIAAQGAVAKTEIPIAGAKTAAEAITQAITKSGKTKKLKSDEFDMSVFNEPVPVQPSINTLSKSFDNALSSYLALPYEQQIIKAKDANAAIGKWLGFNKDGKVKSLLSTNQKLLKTEKGYKGGDPILLPDGRGVENTGLALSPAFKEGKFTTCPNSASCSKECLGKTSGGYFFGGGGKDLSKMLGGRLEGFKKTQAFFRDPENFAIKLHNEITIKKFIAAQNGNQLAVRLNMLSDINPRVHEQLIKAHPDVIFYDYTKNNTNPIAPNHHYTYSSTGISQNVNGQEIINSNQNWKQMRRRLDEGKNVAMAFSHKQLIPETILDEETNKVYKVVSGDAHDFRPADAVPAGVDGVIIGLKNKAAPRSASGAAKESEGFFVHYDPQIPKVKGVLAKDALGNLMIQNTQVKIPKQSTGQITITNDYAPSKEAK